MTLAAVLRNTSQDGELVLISEEKELPRTIFDGYRVMRRCAADLTATDVAWLGRHLSRTKLGLALGAGGAKCFAHAGVIQALQSAGYTIDYVAGSSMGAVVGGWRSVCLGLKSKPCCASTADQKPLSIRFFAKERQEMDWTRSREFFERPPPIAPSLISRFQRQS